MQMLKHECFKDHESCYSFRATQDLSGEELVKHEKFLKAKDKNHCAGDMMRQNHQHVCEEAFSQLAEKQSTPIKAPAFMLTFSSANACVLTPCGSFTASGHWHPLANKSASSFSPHGLWSDTTPEPQARIVKVWVVLPSTRPQQRRICFWRFWLHAQTGDCSKVGGHSRQSGAGHFMLHMT